MGATATEEQLRARGDAPRYVDDRSDEEERATRRRAAVRAMARLRVEAHAAGVVRS